MVAVGGPGRELSTHVDEARARWFDAPTVALLRRDAEAAREGGRGESWHWHSATGSACSASGRSQRLAGQGLRVDRKVKGP